MPTQSALGNDAFDAWLLEATGGHVQSEDELLADLVSSVIREETAEGRAQRLIETANLCIAMADRNLGSQVSVTTCLTLTRH